MPITPLPPGLSSTTTVRPRRELLEPALEVRLAVDVGAMGLVLARPWEGRHVGDRIFVAAEIFGLAQTLIEQFIEPQHLTLIAAERIFVGLGREQVEMRE